MCLPGKLRRGWYSRALLLTPGTALLMRAALRATRTQGLHTPRPGQDCSHFTYGNAEAPREKAMGWAERGTKWGRKSCFTGSQRARGSCLGDDFKETNTFSEYLCVSRHRRIFFGKVFTSQKWRKLYFPDNVFFHVFMPTSLYMLT